ncbi:hypothetical protein [Flavobacterium wongokense]|uniref:hypothetical protein n=1 Tax=Flavobacterium wongokense TaxID=2910674 RepID=UPI001F38511C|nr:hypothetical protein [Flavobacterium sp. WG47]MCF6132401.1 hypothetical protein [Flavobacterium sp. WG47]
MGTQTMNIDLVQEMVTNYKTKQYLSIVTNTINPMTFDAQSVRFDLTALKAFIDTIEQEVALHPEYNLQDLGVRFYYSAYPNSNDWDKTENQDLAPVPSQYAKLHTLIGIPTAMINGVDSDFNPLDTKTYTGIKPTGVGCAIMAENHGDLNPPGSPSGLWF